MSIEPHLPYLHVPDLVLLPQGVLGGNFPPAPFSLKPFGTLVAIGVYFGAWLAMRQGRRLGLDEKKLMSFMVWVVGSGFVGGHVLDTVFYFPERIAQDPWSLIRLWEGLSSFGGFLGAGIGVFLWHWRYQEPVLPYVDTVASAFPVGWVFGRAGCTLAHDHPGVHSDAWLAVRYPDGGRFDLGMYEMLLTIPLAITFLYLRRRPRPWGLLRRRDEHRVCSQSLRARLSAHPRWQDRGCSLSRAHAGAMGMFWAPRHGRPFALSYPPEARLRPAADHAGGRARSRAGRLTRDWPESQMRMRSAPGATRATSGRRPGVSPSMSMSTSSPDRMGSASMRLPRPLTTLSRPMWEPL